MMPNSDYDPEPDHFDPDWNIERSGKLLGPPPAWLPLDEFDEYVFESLCYELIRRDYRYEGCRRYGSRGERQDGIDIYAFEQGRLGDKLIVFQCKRYKNGLTAGSLKEAVDRFLQGRWRNEAKHFIILLSQERTSTGVEHELIEQKRTLRKLDIDIDIWDGSEISDKLRPHPDVVEKFFLHDAVVQAFCGPYASWVRDTHIYLTGAGAWGAGAVISDARETDEDGESGPIHRTDISGFFKYSDNKIWIDAFLPTVDDRYHGSCAIGIKQKDLDGCIITVGHREMLSTLFRGHHSDINDNARAIVVHGPSDDLDSYAVQMGGTRLFLREATARALCVAVDSLHEAYLEALERVDEAWEAEGCRYVDYGGLGVTVLLGTMPAWLWSSIIRFAEEQNEPEGGWPTLHASARILEARSTTCSRRFDSGLHASIVVADHAGIGLSAAKSLAVLWRPPQYRPDLYPLSERRYWGAATTLRWMNDELLPRVHEWMWSKQPWAVRWGLRRARRKAEFLSGLVSQGGVADFREPSPLSADGCPDLAKLQRLVAALQQSFNTSSAVGCTFEPDTITELYRAIILALRHIEIDYLGYAANRLDAIEARNKDELISILERKAERGNLLASRSAADYGLRALLDILWAREVHLNGQEITQILSHLGPLVRTQHDQDTRRRHMLG